VIDHSHGIFPVFAFAFHPNSFAGSSADAAQNSHNGDGILTPTFDGPHVVA
jgi:hypothetical protein